MIRSAMDMDTADVDAEIAVAANGKNG